MDIASRMKAISESLPERKGYVRGYPRDVCLTYDAFREVPSWSVLAGGHPAVHVGEWGGDFQGEGATAEEALTACENAIGNHSG